MYDPGGKQKSAVDAIRLYGWNQFFLFRGRKAFYANSRRYCSIPRPSRIGRIIPYTRYIPHPRYELTGETNKSLGKNKKKKKSARSLVNMWTSACTRTCVCRGRARGGQKSTLTLEQCTCTCSVLRTSTIDYKLDFNSTDDFVAASAHHRRRREQSYTRSTYTNTSGSVEGPTW